MAWYVLYCIAWHLGKFTVNADGEFQVCSVQFNFICNSFVFVRSSISFAEICETDIKRKISLCEELIKVVRVLEPGKSIFRGKLLVDLQEALFAETERRVNNGEMSKLVARVCIILIYIHFNFAKFYQNTPII